MKSRLIPIGLLAIALAGCNPFYSVEQSGVERGYRWVHRGEMDKTIADYDKAIVLNPKDEAAIKNREILKGIWGKWEMKE